MNYIEFKKDENLIVKIHYNGKLRVIKNKTNVKKILELCEKYGYGKIDEDSYKTIFMKLLQIMKNFTIKRKII